MTIPAATICSGIGAPETALSRRPRVLIGYEASGIVRRAFRALGCDAFSCDVLPARDGSPYHIEADIWEVAGDQWDAGIFFPMCTYLTVSAAWAFNDPDFRRYPGVGYHQKVRPGSLTGEARREARREAIQNFQQLLDLPYPKAIENPANSFVSKAIRPADQRIQPFHFGDDGSKITGLWLDRLPRLRPTAFAEPRRTPRPMGSGASDRARAADGCASERGDLFGSGLMRWSNQTDTGQNRLSPSDDRWLKRSETWPGIAAAMGDQWGRWILERVERQYAAHGDGGRR